MNERLSLPNSPQTAEVFIFVISERQDICERLTTILESTGVYHAYSFTRVTHALYLVGSLVPDLFLMDYIFAHENTTGLELYHHLQAANTPSPVPCILLNAPPSALKEPQIWSLREPFDPDILLQTVRNALRFSPDEENDILRYISP